LLCETPDALAQWLAMNVRLPPSPARLRNLRVCYRNLRLHAELPSIGILETLIRTNRAALIFFHTSNDLKTERIFSLFVTNLVIT
jgi:hypothetical protein